MPEKPPTPNSGRTGERLVKPSRKARGLAGRPWLQRRTRFENRLARRLRKIARWLEEDTNRLLRQAVVDFHKAKGTWPQPDHIYPEMRG